MYKRKFDIKKVLAPTDGISIVVIIVGLLIAIFLDQLAVRLIGVSIALIGGVALAMLISQRMRDIVDTRYTPSVKPPSSVKVIKDQYGSRHVFDDVDISIGPDVEQTEPVKGKPLIDIIMPEVKLEKKEGPVILRSDDNEEITIRPKSRLVSTETVVTAPDPVIPKVRYEVPDEGVTFSDGESGFTLRPVKKEDKPEDIPVPRPEIKIEIKVPVPIEEDIFEEEIIEEDLVEAGYQQELFRDPDSFIVTKHIESQPEEEKIPVELPKDLPQKEIPEEKEVQEKPAEIPVEKINPQVYKAIEGYTEKKIDVPVSSLMESEQIDSNEPRKEFEFFLIRVLKIIRSITNTRTAAFLLVNHEKKELIIQAYDTEVPEAITSKHKIPLKNDIISQIIKNVRPEILSEINPAAELDLIPYYSTPVGTSSFIGVPVFYNKTVIGILCGDSSADDAYDAFTVGFLAHFTRLIGSLVNTYTEKYELQQASRTLTAISSFRNFVGADNLTLGDIYNSIIESSSKIFDYSTLGICGYNPDKEIWEISTIISKNDSDTGLIHQPVSMNGTLVGKSITESKTIFIRNPDANQIMYHKDETKYEGGFFASVPFKSITNTYGSLFVMGKSMSNITSYDLKILETLCESAGSSMEHFLFLQMLQSNTMTDKSGILNSGALYERLEEELIKSNDYDIPLVLCIYKLDTYEALDKNLYRERLQKVNHHVTDIVRKYLKAYHPFGKFSEDIYGMILTGMTSDQASKWAEKVRGDIARNLMIIDDKKIIVTVSIGIAQAVRSDSVDSIVNNTITALDLASKKKNQVIVFE